MKNHIRRILAGSRNNERRSQKELYQLFYEFVFSICYRYANEWSELEKLVSDSFIKVFTRINEFDDDQFADTYIFSSVRLWIKQWVLFACIEHCRKNIKNHNELNALPELGKEQKFAASSVNTSSHKQIIEAIRKLPLLNRVIYNLSVIDAMPNEKIAILLGISIIELQSTLEKAREKLRVHLSKQGFLSQNITSDSVYSTLILENRPIPLLMK